LKALLGAVREWYSLLSKRSGQHPSIILNVVGVMSTTATVSSNDEGLVPEGINLQHQPSSDAADVVSCHSEIFSKMEENYNSFTKKASSQRYKYQEEDREVSMQLRDEVANLLTEGNLLNQNNMNGITNNTNGSQETLEELNAASLVRLLSSQMEKFDHLLQKNESSQETIIQLQQRSDWLKETCQAFERSEAKKVKKISSLEKKIDDLEKLVIEMKLNEAESRSREDHYKLQIANLEQLLEKSAEPSMQGVEPRRQRKGASKHTQSLIIPPASNARLKGHPERNPLNRSFTSFFKRGDNSDVDETPKVAGSKPNLRNSSLRNSNIRNASLRNSARLSCSEAIKELQREDEQKIAATVRRPKLRTSDEVILEPSEWYNPKRSVSNSAINDPSLPISVPTIRETNDPSIPISVPTIRETHLSNITDLTEETPIDEADRSFGSDSSFQQAELDLCPVFEPAGPQMKLKLSFRASETRPKREEENKKEEDNHGEAVPENFLAYC